ncbi:telethonin-like isoform X1 [Chiloscyllium plagiosum]|uniref:telethonin-like isoform X1 n=1 Tax=Chiloscyllium plagiosum TaxID=36176 RepID=UPI001CB7DF8E|nr:telethonin-like isoform X1 [Chiloscyllium plagiosum]
MPLAADGKGEGRYRGGEPVSPFPPFLKGRNGLLDLKQRESPAGKREKDYDEERLKQDGQLKINALTEDDITRKEHYGQNQQVTFIVQNSPDQKMRIGRLGEKAVEYQLPYKNVLPVPVFVPCKIKSVTKEDLKPEFSLSLEELRGKERFERALNNTWSFPDKQQVSVMEKELPRIVQPASGNFRASALLSPLNIYSQPEAAHRG